MTALSDLLRAAETARAARPTVPLAIATLVRVEGSSYRQPGARLLVDAEGRVLAGAISGGCLEGDVAARAAAVCASGRGILLRYDLRNDLETIWGFGSACDGIATIVLEPLGEGEWLREAEGLRAKRIPAIIKTSFGHNTNATLGVVQSDEIPPAALLTPIGVAARTLRPAVDAGAAERDGDQLFLDPVAPPVALHLIGAGRGAEAFARIGTTLGWQVTLVDHRPGLLESVELPEGVARRVGDATLADELPTDGRTAVALLSHIYESDLAWLARLATRPLAYLGILGSRQRAARLMEALASAGVTLTPVQRARVHAPIGLDLGGETPAEIALAAIAEIEATINGRPAGSLRDRQTPIHERTPVPVSTTTGEGGDSGAGTDVASPGCTLDR